MHSVLSHPDHAAWLYHSAGPYFAHWRNDLLPLPLLLQPYGTPMDQPSPLSDAHTSPSPSESSLMSEDGSHSPRHLNVVCNVPIVVPKPRPYRSLANLQLQFDLPSEDQDLSHPPYCSSRSAAKRKRSDDDDDADDGFSPTPPSADRGSKRRRAILDSSLSLSTPTAHPDLLPRSLHGSQPVTRRIQTTSNQSRHRQPQARPR